MTESGDTKDDLQLPSGTDEAEKLAQQARRWGVAWAAARRLARRACHRRSPSASAALALTPRPAAPPLLTLARACS